LKQDFDLDCYLFDKYENQDEIVCVLKDKEHLQWLSDAEQLRRGVEIDHADFKTRLKLTGR
jgi:hypothetical protein